MFSAQCMADVDGCKEMSKKTSDAALPEIRKAFMESHKFPVNEVSVSSGRDCGDSVYYVFEATGKYANVGYHWIVTKYKSSGKIEITDGI
ncbi:hypothetical protein GCM10007863_22770 [Dyella mobilis]|nr:hypothetical protein GCM10007863_22770 [Dyella mobilis]